MRKAAKWGSAKLFNLQLFLAARTTVPQHLVCKMAAKQGKREVLGIIYVRAVLPSGAFFPFGTGWLSGVAKHNVRGQPLTAHSPADHTQLERHRKRATLRKCPFHTCMYARVHHHAWGRSCVALYQAVYMETGRGQQAHQINPLTQTIGLRKGAAGHEQSAHGHDPRVSGISQGIRGQ